MVASETRKMAKGCASVRGSANFTAQRVELAPDECGAGCRLHPIVVRILDKSCAPPRSAVSTCSVPLEVWCSRPPRGMPSVIVVLFARCPMYIGPLRRDWLDM